MLADADRILSTPRLRLRGFAVRDATPLNALMERPGVPEWLKIARADPPWDAWWRALRGGGARARRYTVTHAGDDRLIAESGRDVLRGGAGRDDFVLKTAEAGMPHALWKTILRVFSALGSVSFWIESV